MAGRTYRIVCANGDERRYTDGRVTTADTYEAAERLRRTWDLADSYKAKPTGPHRVERSGDGGKTWEEL